mmetsp:Transcript_24930/g.47197  ORF Transcript_24930/g.47197 Transcript_24930/m.47197 type:complete len:171 (+) Transcript_24930:114-626(+)
MGGEVLVTVGTTSFDELVAEVNSPSALKALANLGFDAISFQIGQSSYKPVFRADDPLKVSFFNLAPSMAAYFERASLVISHAGSGSIFESLRAGVPVIVVVNEALMDNHQMELANELAFRKHCAVATPESLLETLQSFDMKSLSPYVTGSPSLIANEIDSILRVSPRDRM